MALDMLQTNKRLIFYILKTCFLGLVLSVFSCVDDDVEELKNTEINTENENDLEETFPLASLNNHFFNALISDKYNNINRLNPIRITDYDNVGNRIKTNYTNLERLTVFGHNGQSWFVTQGSEASAVVEIKSVNLDTGWISLGDKVTGNLNKNPNAKIEFFNPFVNYSIIKDKPLFNPYPTSVAEGEFNYIQPGGIFQKTDGTYVLLTPVVFGAHSKRSLYFASSTNLEDWTFHNEKILSTNMIPFAKTNGNVFSTDNPYPLENGNFIVLLGVQQPNNNYTSAYMIIDENLNIVMQPKEILIPDWNGPLQNSFPLALTKFENKFRILFHRRHPNFLDREIHEVIVEDLLPAFNSNTGVISSTLIHKGTVSTGYLRGKADDAAYINYNSKLHILLGAEEVSSNYLTSNNREYGLMNWNLDEWKHDSRSPLLVNPVQLQNKYPIYNWAWDHLGGFVSPIFKDNTLYIYMAFGTDNPDYFISGVKVFLNE